MRGASTYWDLHSDCFNQVDADGKNQWVDAPDSTQAYLVKKAEPSVVGDALSKMLATLPTK